MQTAPLRWALLQGWTYKYHRDSSPSGRESQSPWWQRLSIWMMVWTTGGHSMLSMRSVQNFRDDVPEKKKKKQQQENKTWFTVMLLRRVRKNHTDGNSVFVCFSTQPTKFLPPSDIFALSCISSVVWPQVLCQPFLSHPVHRFHLTFFLATAPPPLHPTPLHLRSRPFMLERRACGSMASMRLTDYCNSYTLISCTNH